MLFAYSFVIRAGPPRCRAVVLFNVRGFSSGRPTCGAVMTFNVRGFSFGRQSFNVRGFSSGTRIAELLIWLPSGRLGFHRMQLCSGSPEDGGPAELASSNALVPQRAGGGGIQDRSL